MKLKSISIVIGAILGIIALHFLLDTSDVGKEKEVKIETTTTATNKESKGNITTNTNKSMDTNITELKIEDEVVGTGAVAQAGDNVVVHYVGTLTNGTVFDASKNRGDEGFTFTLGVGQVIQGWDKGVAGMKVGGKRKLYIPSDMAYGPRAVGNVIPANSALIFEVELLDVIKK